MNFKRRPHQTIWIVIRWSGTENYQVIRAFPSYGLAELWILGQLDNYTYTIEKTIY